VSPDVPLVSLAAISPSVAVVHSTINIPRVPAVGCGYFHFSPPMSVTKLKFVNYATIALAPTPSLLVVFFFYQTF
jgi:hypothetical protein